MFDSKPIPKRRLSGSLGSILNYGRYSQVPRKTRLPEADAPTDVVQKACLRLECVSS